MMPLVDLTRAHGVDPADSTVEPTQTCPVCDGGISAGAGRYRLGEHEYHALCFKFWLTAPLTSEAQTAK